MRNKRRTIKMLVKVLMCLYVVSICYNLMYEESQPCPRHYLVHNGKPCSRLVPQLPDFIGGSDPSACLYVYSALHELTHSHIILTMLIQRFEQPRFVCQARFTGSDTYYTLQLGAFVCSYQEMDRNSHGDLIDSCRVACRYGMLKQKFGGITLEPQYVQLVKYYDRSSVLAGEVPVEEIIKPVAERGSLALCLSRVYSEPYCPTCSGMNYTYHLPEWLEMQRLMGVQVVYVYNQSMSLDASTVFSHYARQGFVEILSHAPIHRESYMPNSVGLTDCIIRNQYLFDHILVMDTDEFLVPTKHDTYQQLIEELFSKLRRNQYHVQFSSAHFPTDRHESAAADHYLKTQSYNNHYMVGHGSGKSIVNPRYCHIATAHECQYVTRPKATVQVPPEVAMVHHYKDCNSQRFADGINACKLACLTFNNSTARFRDRLNKAVRNSFREMGLWGV